MEKKTDAGERWDKKERKFFSIFNGIWLPNTEEKKIFAQLEVTYKCVPISKH